VSGDDGSYTLTRLVRASAPIPTSNTVNVNNRVQIAPPPACPSDVQRQGVTVKKKSSALLGSVGVIALYSPKHTHDQALSCRTTSPSTCSNAIKSTGKGVGATGPVGAAGLFDGAWVGEGTDQLTGTQTSPPATIINASRAQNVQARGSAAIGARRSPTTSSFQINIQGPRGGWTSVEEFQNTSSIRTNFRTDRCCGSARWPGFELGAAHL